MLAYAASRPVVADRPSSPSALLIVIGLHAAVLATVMSAKMDLPSAIRDLPIGVELIPQPKPPPPERRRQSARGRRPTIDRSTTRPPIVPIKPDGFQWPSTTPQWIRGRSSDLRPLPIPDPPRPVVLARAMPGSSHPAWDLSRLIPVSKIASEEEAVLRLRITIDERGRVIAVEPLDRVDPAFLESAGATCSPTGATSRRSRADAPCVLDGDQASLPARRLIRATGGRRPTALSLRMSWFPRPSRPLGAFATLALSCAIAAASS